MAFAASLKRTALAAAMLAITACGAEEAQRASRGEGNAAAKPMREGSPGAETLEPEGLKPPSATLNGVDVPPSTEAPGPEVAAERVQGLWQVTDAAGAASGRGMVGRTLSFTDAALGWLGTDGRVEQGCSDPYFHVVADAAQVRAFAPAFKPGWPQFRLRPDDVGAMHVWECGDVEQLFGPPEPAAGSAFFPVAADRMVMNWHDGAVLLLRRESQPTDKLSS